MYTKCCITKMEHTNFLSSFGALDVHISLHSVFGKVMTHLVAISHTSFFLFKQKTIIKKHLNEVKIEGNFQYEAYGMTLPLLAPTLRCQGMVPPVVLAIVIYQMVGLNPPHDPVLLLRQPSRPERGGRYRVAPGRGIGAATAGFEIGILCNKWLISVICFVFPIFSCPR